jgi:uncharacterized protein YjcR
MTNKEKEVLAQTLYMSGKFSQKAISEMTEVSERTIGKWVEKKNWEQMRHLQSVTRAELLKEAYAQLARINKKINEEMAASPISSSQTPRRSACAR